EQHAADRRSPRSRSSCLMPSLPSVSGERVVKAFLRDGWVKDRQHGSHVILVKRGHPSSLSVPQHRSLAPGTLRSLLRCAGMTVAEFCEQLRLTPPPAPSPAEPRQPVRPSPTMPPASSLPQGSPSTLP